jgi:hypothetical protein
MVKYLIEHEYRLVITIAEGDVDYNEVKNHQNRLLADPNFNIEYNQLIDTVGVNRFELTGNDVRMLCERPIVSPQSRRAFVALKPHVYGLGRMMQIYHDELFGHANVEVFYHLDAAYTWLGVELK